MKIALLSFAAVTGCHAFGSLSTGLPRARGAVMRHGPEPHDLTTVSEADVRAAAEEAAQLLAEEKEVAAKAKWLADRDVRPATSKTTKADEDPDVTKWARDEAAKSVIDMLYAKAADEIETPSSSPGAGEIVPSSKDEIAKAELMKVASSVGSLGLAAGKAAVHSIAAVTLDGASSLAGAAGNAVKSSMLDLQSRGHQMGEQFKADVAAAPGKAAAHLLAQVQAVPVKAAEHIKAEVEAIPVRAAQAARAAAQERIDAVKAVPEKARRRVERKVEAKTEEVKKRLRAAAMERIDRIIPGRK